MKLKAPDAAAATARSPINWLLGICLAAFLTIIYPSSVVAETGAGGLNYAEEWVVKRVTAGEIADLSRGFHEEENRKLSAHFLEALLTGTLPDVKPHRHGVQIVGAIIEEPIDLRSAQIPCDVMLARCQFNRNVTFARANVAGFFSFSDSTFKADADFNSMKVERTAFFRKTVFEGMVNFTLADIANNFEADGAKFQNTEKGVTFTGIKVRGSALFWKGTEFQGPVNFFLADIASNFETQDAKFQNKQEGANFNRMKVGGDAVFQNAVFEGPVGFVGADIANNFEAKEAQFNNEEKRISFNRMKVEGDANFHGAVFEGPVDFISADIASEFHLTRAKFQNRKHGPAFNGMKVRIAAFLNDAMFEGPVDLNVSGASWPKDSAQFHVEGMSYKAILAEEPKSHEKLLKLVSQAAYSADVYSRLEEFFLRQGYRADADEAFIAGKRRERDEYFRSGDWFGWLRSWMLYLLAMGVNRGKPAFPVQF